MHQDLLYPFDAAHLLRHRKRLRRELLAGGSWIDVRLAVLAGSTAQEVLDFLELFLLNDGIRPVFYQSDYNRFYEEALFDTARLEEFRPDLIYVHTSTLNVLDYPHLTAPADEIERCVETELARYESIWNAVKSRLECQLIQNNFEPPATRGTGSFDGTSPTGRSHFLNRLNLEIARRALGDRRIVLHDLASVAAITGLDQWSDPSRWFSYKIPTTPAGSAMWAHSLANTIRAIYGRSRKCLVLDLDNTLWGGVIGDDGVERIRIGKETAEGEAFTAFQEYCLALRQRGILLAVCSKNDEGVAREGFAHPSSVLHLEHFSAFVANWEPKSENISRIAAALNIGLESMVFVDDNPAERAIVRAQLPAVAVPEVGDDVSRYPLILDRGGYFDVVSLSSDDVNRNAQYAANEERASLSATYASYGDYLAALEMRAEIAPFCDVYLERITQLTNKTNQFNLTTRRYTMSEIAQIASEPRYITLYGRLEDRFGDNGLVSVIVGRMDGKVLHIDLWLMSCRVIQREMELAMLDALVARALDAGVETLAAYYVRTPKNNMVADHYDKLGFERVSLADDGSSGEWRFDLRPDYSPRNTHIARIV
jgi:HAD-superfamily phosphatase, subfamily IIIC/FkbH-like domain